MSAKLMGEIGLQELILYVNLEGILDDINT